MPCEIPAARAAQTATPAGATTLVDAGRAALRRGDPASAARLLRRALDEGTAHWRADLLAALGESELRLGEPAAPEHLRAARETATGDSRRELDLAVARALIAQGREDEALPALAEAADGTRATQPDLALRLDAYLIAAAGACPAWSGPARRRASAARAAEGAAEPAARAVILAALAADAAGRGEDAALALALAERGLDGAGAEPPESPVPAAAATDLRAAGTALARAGLTSPAVLPWRVWAARALAAAGEVAAALARSEARLEHAHALGDLGAELRRAGQRRAAREPLRAALDLAGRCGATALERAARVALRTAGARPRRAALTGVEALTPAELRAARLAAGGRSNRQIAAELFVSVKTVETELGHAYAKLAIRSRDALAAALEGGRESAGRELIEHPVHAEQRPAMGAPAE